MAFLQFKKYAKKKDKNFVALPCTDNSVAIDINHKTLKEI
jgi:hypothetical protein